MSKNVDTVCVCVRILVLQICWLSHFFTRFYYRCNLDSSMKFLMQINTLVIKHSHLQHIKIFMVDYYQLENVDMQTACQWRKKKRNEKKKENENGICEAKNNGRERVCCCCFFNIYIKVNPTIFLIHFPHITSFNGLCFLFYLFEGLYVSIDCLKLNRCLVKVTQSVCLLDW